MIITIHLIAAVIALVLGAIILVNVKGTARHKWLGKLWVVTMLIVTVSSFWIKELTGNFSWIHILSIITIISVSTAIMAIRQGNRRLHKLNMIGSYCGLAIAGMFTLLPGRLLNTFFQGLM